MANDCIRMESVRDGDRIALTTAKRYHIVSAKLCDYIAANKNEYRVLI